MSQFAEGKNAKDEMQVEFCTFIGSDAFKETSVSSALATTSTITSRQMANR